MALFAQGSSVTRWLVEKKDHATFLAFVKQGMTDGWNKAAASHYKFADVEDLEKAWRAALKETKERD